MPSTADPEWMQSAETVSEGLHRLPLPLPNDGLRAVNVYALVADDGSLTLIDSGWWVPEARDRLFVLLDKLGLAPQDIRRILVTHMHRDHYSLGVQLRRDFGMTVALGAGERASIDVILDPAHRPLDGQIAGLRGMGATDLADELAAAMARHEPDPGERPGYEAPDMWLEDGVVVPASGRKLEVVETPGHTRGHVVFHDVAAAQLFAGDHVLPTITPSIAVEPAPNVNPLGDYLRSLALVRSRPDALLLPAHGPVAPSVHARVDELVAHHGRRLDATYDAVIAGATTSYEVAQRLGWTRRERRFDELDLFNRMLAVGETRAHLELLVAQGRLRSQDEDGVLHYAEA